MGWERGDPEARGPLLGAAEDTHGVVDGCIDASLLPAGSNSTGRPTTFPNGPGMGATFNRALGAFADCVVRPWHIPNIDSHIN